MKTAAIVIDDWKLLIFKKTLDAEGYVYTEHKGISRDSIILKVKTDDISKLHEVVNKMNQDAANSKLN